MSKRLVGVSIVKNEADIIEAFVRHNLRFLDQLILTDHHSTDATPVILRALAAEGLPLTLTPVQSDPVYIQADWTTQLAEHAFGNYAADFVFPLDADEFLRADSRATLETALASLSTTVAWMDWPTYVRNGEDVGHPMQVLRWRVDARASPPGKVVLSRRLLAGSKWKLSEGNHLVLTRANNGEWEVAAASHLPGVELAHLPLRSVEQLQAKILTGWLVRRLTLGAEVCANSNNQHVREMYRRIMRGDVITNAEVRDYAISMYACGCAHDAAEAAGVRLIEDSFGEPFTALRYTPQAAARPALLLAAWAETLVERLVHAQVAQK